MLFPRNSEVTVPLSVSLPFFPHMKHHHEQRKTLPAVVVAVHASIPPL